MAMLTYTFVLFVALQVLGVLFFAWTSAATSLIPALIADLFLACFLFGIKPNWRKHAMHAGVAIALLIGLLGLIMGFKGLYTGLFGPKGSHMRGRAVLEQFIMAGLCLGYLALGIRSFIAARRARRGGAPGSSADPSAGPPPQPSGAGDWPAEPPPSTEPAQKPRIDPEP